MKIKLSKVQWEKIGQKAGWMGEDLKEKSQKWWHSLSINQMKELTKKHYPNVTGSFINQTPGLVEDIYQKESQKNQLEDLHDNISKRRSVKVTFNDGDVISTEINGTKKEIEDYYLKHNFVKGDEKTMHHGISVEFLD